MTFQRTRGANDQDKHGRKQNSGTNDKTLRELGSRRERGTDGADSDPKRASKQPGKPADPD
jgi:hypothetical protein